jgi:transposase-like protein
VFVKSPDDILWRYLSLRERIASASGRQPVAEKGLVFAEKCPGCKALDREARMEEQDKRTGASRWVCIECEAAWPVEVAFLLRNEFQSTPKVDAAADLYAELATYYQMLSKLLLREQRIYLLLYLYENVGGYREVALESNRRWPTFRPPHGSRGPRPATWSSWTVQRVIVDARRRLNDELRHRGLRGRYA